MKSTMQIWFSNLRGFTETGLLKEGQATSFRIEADEDLPSKLKEHGYTNDEIRDACTRILKGNPHWVKLENLNELKLSEKVQDDKAHEKMRKEQLKALDKKEQLKLLKELGANQIPHFEVDKINLIYELELKKEA